MCQQQHLSFSFSLYNLWLIMPNDTCVHPTQRYYHTYMSMQSCGLFYSSQPGKGVNYLAFHLSFPPFISIFYFFFTLHLPPQPYIVRQIGVPEVKEPLVKKNPPTPPPSQCLPPFILLILFLSSLHLIHPHTFFSPLPPMHAKWTREPRSDFLFSPIPLFSSLSISFSDVKCNMIQYPAGQFNKI